MLYLTFTILDYNLMYSVSIVFGYDLSKKRFNTNVLCKNHVLYFFTNLFIYFLKSQVIYRYINIHSYEFPVYEA